MNFVRGSDMIKQSDSRAASVGTIRETMLLVEGVVFITIGILRLSPAIIS